MTKISDNEVRDLAQLSGLELDDSEVGSLAEDIGRILTYVEQLNELDTEGVVPAYQITDRSNVWRDDLVVDDGVGREKLLKLPAASRDNQVEVPKVL